MKRGIVRIGFRVLLFYLAVTLVACLGCSQSTGLTPPDQTVTRNSGLTDGVSGVINSAPSPDTPEDTRPIYVEDEVLVVLHDEAEPEHGPTFFDNLPVQIVREKTYNWGTLHRIKITDGTSVESMVELLRDDPRVRFAEPNYLLYFCSEPYWPDDPMWEGSDPDNDPRTSTTEQWGPAKLGASIIWNDSIGDENIIVAIVDTGIRRTHEDLENQIWYNTDEIADNGIDDDANGWIDDTWGWDCFNNDNDPWDDQPWNHYHGTGCAGVVAAEQDNGIGISGVAPGVQLMAVKADMDDGPTCVDSVVEAWDYAKKNGADIVSMSFGVIYPTEVLETAAFDTWDDGDGPILMASAGNANNQSPYAPARYECVICVGATVPFSRWGNPVDERRIQKNWAGWWWGSTYGPLLNIMAFGEKYYSTYGSGDSEYWDGVNHYFFNGTSCACPNSAAVMALILTFHPNQEGQWYWDRIEDTADDLETPGFDIETGNGRVNAVRAVYGSDRYEDLEDDDGFVTISPDSTLLSPELPLFDSIHDRPGNPFHDTSDLYRIETGQSGPVRIFLDIFTWGENLDMALYADEDMTELIDSGLVVNHATSSFEEISLDAESGEDYYLEIFPASEGDSTTYGLYVEYIDNELILTGEGIAPVSAHPGETGIQFIKLNLDPIYPAVLDRLTLTAGGGASAWGLIKLYHDSNDNGTFEDTDNLIALVPHMDGDIAEFNNLGFYLDGDDPATFFIVADLSPDAQFGSIVSLAIEDTADFGIMPDTFIDPTSLPIASGSVIIN